MNTKTIRLLILVSSALALGSGCAALSMGEEEFSCPGQPKGVLCVGPTEAYELTHSRDSLEDMMVDPETHNCENGECRPDAIAAKQAQTESNEPQPEEDSTSATPNAQAGASEQQNDVDYTYAPSSERRQYDGETEPAVVVAQVGDTDPGTVKAATQQGQLQQYSNAPHAPAPEPLAVLKAPEVMRILIAPWEDEQGDLNMPGYVYVELNPRQWITGHQANSRPSRTVPFQVISDANNSKTKQNAAGKGVNSLGVIQAPQK